MSNRHDHPAPQPPCVHDIAYCDKCDVCYCKKCDKDWVRENIRQLKEMPILPRHIPGGNKFYCQATNAKGIDIPIIPAKHL